MSGKYRVFYTYVVLVSVLMFLTGLFSVWFYWQLGAALMSVGWLVTYAVYLAKDEL